MAWQVQDSDYLELWKYFEDRADAVKEAMFTTVTWTVGFSAAIMGFVATNLVELKDPTPRLPHPGVVLGVAFVGLVLSSYSFILIRESADHIQRNWRRAEHCRDQVDGLKGICSVGNEHPTRRPVWQQVSAVVGLFALGFCGIVLLALASLTP